MREGHTKISNYPLFCIFCVIFGGISFSIFFRRDEDGRLVYWVDEEYHNKECEPKDCPYFKNIVLPGVK
jgi:hypothetical protein